MKLVAMRLKVFDMKNPNCKLINMPTKAMISYAPILLLEGEKETVVGVVSLYSINTDTTELEVIGNEIFAQVFIKERYENLVEFFNYEIEGKLSEIQKGFQIERVSAVIVKLKVV